MTGGDQPREDQMRHGDRHDGRPEPRPVAQLPAPSGGEDDANSAEKHSVAAIGSSQICDRSQNNANPPATNRSISFRFKCPNFGCGTARPLNSSKIRAPLGNGQEYDLSSR